MSDNTYTVAGMTCGHCVSAVSSEVGDVPGVTEVEVDLSTGQVRVHGADFTHERVRAAVDTAGYKFVSTWPSTSATQHYLTQPRIT